jgi:hypothetical protein
MMKCPIAAIREEDMRSVLTETTPSQRNRAVWGGTLIVM